MEIIINNKAVNLDTIKVDGVYSWDLENSNAYVCFAKFLDGSALNRKELEQITDNYPEFVNYLALKNL
jgi:hypothetical protein|tara:strand:+ start:1369 stop:1572 length:204 start_codon:yes stop_codon:yes gene_type:complete